MDAEKRFLCFGKHSYGQEDGISYWIKEDNSGYYGLLSSDFGEETLFFNWEEIEGPLSQFEESPFDADRLLAQRVREKIAPYYQKPKSQDSSNREEI